MYCFYCKWNKIDHVYGMVTHYHSSAVEIKHFWPDRTGVNFYTEYCKLYIEIVNIQVPVGTWYEYQKGWTDHRPYIVV